MDRYLLFLKPTRPEMPEGPTPVEANAIAAHFDYLEECLEADVLLIAGRTLDSPFVGVAVFQAKNLEEAQRFMEDDPAISAGVFQAEVRPFSLALMKGVAPDAPQ